MKQIKNHRTGTVIFEGDFASLRDCAEHAAGDGVCLDFADLAHANLVNASLDETSLRCARLHGANLTGANLSEADLDGSDFTDAVLCNTCLCFSSLRHCRFDGALFGAADITGSAVDRCVFSTLSAFHLNFRGAGSMDGCIYVDPENIHCPFSRPPAVVAGLAWPVVVMDRHIKIGSRIMTHGRFLSGAGTGEYALDAFINQEKNWLIPLVEGFVDSVTARLSA